MKDATLITITGLTLTTAFGSVALYLGYDGYLAGTIIFVLAAGMGVALPQPAFLRKE